MANTNSILATDFGSVTTRVILIDVVEDKYRLVARGSGRTTDGYPVNDIGVGFDRVLRDIGSATGREFVDDAGNLMTPQHPDGQGVDLFATTASIGRPLRAVVIGLTPNVSIASAIRAASGTYIEVPTIISLEDGRNEEERLNAIILSYPDIIFIVGGTEQGAESPVLLLSEVAKLAVTLIDRTRRPAVIFSGNSQLENPIRDMFSELTTVLVSENVRPTLHQEQYDSARLQLGYAFDLYKENRSEAFAQIGRMSNTGLLPTGQSYSVIADYLGKAESGGVALLDVGSSSSTLAVSMDGEMTTSIRIDVGLGHSAPTLLETVDHSILHHWLPFYISETELKNYTMNKMLRPSTIPATVRDLFIEHAMVKAAVHELVVSANAQWTDIHLALSRIISGGGTLTNTGHPGYDALMILDTLQPIGVSVLESDPYGLVPAMGAIATELPEAVVQLLDNDSLLPLGTAFSLGGPVRQDKLAMRVTIKSLDHEETGKTHKLTVEGGHLATFDLPPGHKAEVSMKCVGGTSMNGKRSVKLVVTGGLVGLIFDARGRGIKLPNTVEERAQLMTMWVHEMTGNPIIEIDPEWFVPLEEEARPPLARPQRQKESRRQRRRGRRHKEEATSIDDVEPSFESLLALEDNNGNEDELDELRNVLS